MLDKKSVGSRTRRGRRKKQPKFVTPDLVYFAGQKIRFVAEEGNALSEAERLCGEYAEMEEGDEAEERQFLQRVYRVADQFRRRPGDFERLQAHAFWERWRPKPKDPSRSKWVLYFIMQATTTTVRKRADQYAVILDGLIREKVSPDTAAARIKELRGVENAHAGRSEEKRVPPPVRPKRRLHKRKPKVRPWGGRHTSIFDK